MPERRKSEPGDQGPQPFRGFGPKALRFFDNLGSNNDREWFQQHRSEYENEVQRPLAELVTALAAELSQRGVPLTGDPKRSIFRIHRDVRFSNDKSPYKTHAGAVLTRDGTKNSQGLLYIHVASQGSFTAAGFYHPDPDQLAALRREIAAAPERFEALERALKKARLEVGRDEALTRLPRGFDHVPPGPTAETLKLKSFVVHRPLSEESLSRPRLIKEIADFAEEALPLLNFGWAALDAKKSEAPPETKTSSPRRAGRARPES
jgi:uncharacterized protein (TIGR02453 family)